MTGHNTSGEKFWESQVPSDNISQNQKGRKKEFKPLVLSKDRRELYDFDVTSDDYQEESSAVS